MPHIQPSVPQPPPTPPSSAVAPPAGSPASPPTPLVPAAPVEPPVPAAAAQDQAVVEPRASFPFENEPVSFPEPLESRPQELPGFGEILGGLAAFMVPGGAPSASFTPLIQQAEKSLQARRAPKAPEPIDTAASDSQMQTP